MPTLSHADSQRLYSWWWDSHISPKSSKWLQEDLTDMDIKVKHMIKLIEEDGDSFAMRAEMYYKRRPELIKLVEEFYRAYRALAERYDHATRGLLQAHATMTNEIHNCPFVSLEPLRAFLSAEPEPQSPRILLQAHNLFDPSDFLKDNSGLHSHCHTPRTNGIYSEEFDPLRRKKGLKQVNELFALSVASNMSSFSIKSKKNGQIIQEEPTKISDFELHDGSEVSEVEDEKNHFQNSNQFQDDDDNSSNEPNQSSQFNPSVEFSAQSQEGEGVLSLKHLDYMVQLKKDNEYLHKIVEQMQKETMELKLGSQDEHLHVLQTEAALESLKLLYNQTQEKLEFVSSEKQLGIQMLKKREMDMHILEENLQHAKRDYDRKTEEIDELRISFEEMCMSLEKLQSQCNGDMNLLVREIQRISRQLEDAKSRKQDLEKMVRALELMINSLHDETSHMEKVQSELEDELRGCALEKKVLQLENSHLHEKVNDLELKQVDTIRQMEALTMELQSLQGMVEILRGENLFFKDVHKQREEEALFAGKLENMEEVSEKNHLMFSLLEDANLQLDELKRDMEVLDGSISSLRELNSNLEAENNMLRYQKDAIKRDARKISEENAILECSFRDAKLRMEEMEGNIRCLEDTCQSLSEEKFLIENKWHVMTLQMDCIADTLKSWEKEYMDLHDKHMSLEIEKESTVRRELELTILLNLEKQEKEMFFHSRDAQITALEDRICHLNAEVQFTQVELLNKEFEAFIFEQCLFDQRDKNAILISEQGKMEHELHEQKKAMKDLSDHVGSMKEQIFSIGRAIGVDEFDQKVISQRIKMLRSDSLVMEDENHKLVVEKSVQEIFLRQFAHNALDLIESTDYKMYGILGEHENQKIGEDSDSHRAIIRAMSSEEVPVLTGAYTDFEFEGYSQFDVKMPSKFAHDKECYRKCGAQKEEVKELNAELNRYHKLLSSLNDEVPCFEDCIHTLTHHQEIQEESDVKFEISYQRSPEEVADELQQSADKLGTIKRDVIETEGCGMVSTFISKSGREALRHTETTNLEKEICVISTKDRTTRTDGIENSDHRDGIALKDIQLDSISSISREKETSSPCKNNKSTRDTRGLEVKRVQVPKECMNSHRNWSDIARRLSADAQRLASLQTNLLDVKMRLEHIERINYYQKDSELHSSMEQLKQVEDSITQLIGVNRKLAKRARNSSSSPDRNGIEELEDVCNQQRKGSRKIGRWELELHKAECTLLEFEEGVERQRNRAASGGSRVALSDYLFSRAERKKSAQQFCRCVETKDNCHVRRRRM